jgi:hypothetical protein
LPLIYLCLTALKIFTCTALTTITEILIKLCILYYLSSIFRHSGNTKWTVVLVFVPPYHFISSHWWDNSKTYYFKITLVQKQGMPTITHAQSSITNNISNTSIIFAMFLQCCKAYTNSLTGISFSHLLKHNLMIITCLQNYIFI